MMHNLFPIPVMSTSLPRQLSTAELDFIHGLDMMRNCENSVTPGDLVLENPQLLDLKKCIQHEIDVYFQRVYQAPPDVSLQMTRSWINRSEPGESHHLHDHPNSFVSGVFYIQVIGSDHCIRFQRAPTHDLLRLESTRSTAWNSFYYDVPIRQGDIVMFPSSLCHLVPPVPGNHTRVSLSFNTFPRGNIFDGAYKMGLHISAVS